MHAVQEAGCSGLHTAELRAHCGLETGVWRSSRPGVGSACLQPSESHESSPREWRQVHICLESYDNAYFSGLSLRLPLHHQLLPNLGCPPSLQGFPCLLRLQPYSLTGHMVQPALCGRGQGGRGRSEWQSGWLPWQRAWLLV